MCLKITEDYNEDLFMCATSIKTFEIKYERFKKYLFII